MWKGQAALRSARLQKPHSRQSRTPPEAPNSRQVTASQAHGEIEARARELEPVDAPRGSTIRRFIGIDVMVRNAISLLHERMKGPAILAQLRREILGVDTTLLPTISPHEPDYQARSLHGALMLP